MIQFQTESQAYKNIQAKSTYTLNGQNQDSYTVNCIRLGQNLEKKIVIDFLSNFLSKLLIFYFSQCL